MVKKRRKRINGALIKAAPLMHKELSTTLELLRDDLNTLGTVREGMLSATERIANLLTTIEASKS